jgi:glycosyltransferase involved in cell wall biosynthesis
MSAASGKRILMVSHVLPIPPAAGNEQRIYKLLRWLREAGHQVTLVLRLAGMSTVSAERLLGLREIVAALYLVTAASYETFPSFGRQARRRAVHAIEDGFRRRGLRPPSMLRYPRLQALEDQLCPYNLVGEVGGLCERLGPEVMIAEYVFMSRCLLVAPRGTLRVIDCHDVYSQRAERVETHGVTDPFCINREEEKVCLERADLLMAIQDTEHRALRALSIRGDVITVGVDFDLPDLSGAGSGPVPGRILYVGSDNAINARALQLFLARAWPKIREGHPRAFLHVAGDVSRHVPSSAPAVVPLGFVSSLADEYRRAEIVINPAAAGTGLQIKTVEALTWAKPMVLWPNGAEGLVGVDTAELPVQVATTWEDFAGKVVLLLGDPTLRRELSERARALIRNRFSKEAAYGALAERLSRRIALERRWEHELAARVSKVVRRS